MERYLYNLYQNQKKNVEPHVRDYASDALNWLRKELSDECIRGGGIGFFDLIYLSAVDYAIPQKEMTNLLADQKALLRETGSCIMISESFLKESSSAIQKGKDVVKVGIKYISEKLGLYRRGQLWGWQRTQLEYQEFMIKAGYSDA